MSEDKNTNAVNVISVFITLIVVTASLVYAYVQITYVKMYALNMRNYLYITCGTIKLKIRKQ